MWKRLFTQFLAAQSVFSPSEDTSLLSRLQDLRPALEQIRQISGTAGISIGVLHHGQVVYKDNLGYRDIAAGETADSQTLYHLGSLTKSISSFAIGSLVEDGLLSWETPIRDILSEFEHKDPYITNMTTVVDLLTHRTGLDADISIAFQGNGEFLLPKEQLIPTFNDLDQVDPFRGMWGYNNWGYGVVGQIIEQVARTPLNEYLTRAVYSRLGMQNTTTKISSLHSENIAKPYTTDSKGKPVGLRSAMTFEGSLFEAAGAAYSNVDDMLSYASTILSSYQDGGYSNPMLDTILSGQIPVFGPTFRERSYGMGWIRTQLPGTLGIMGNNLLIQRSLQQLPVIGRGSPSKLCIYHQGSTVGYFSNIALFPETESAVVVLSNSIALTDSPDTISQALVQALFDFPKPIDFVGFTERSAQKLIKTYEQLAADMKAMRREGTRRFDPGQYAGRYINDLQNFILEIRLGANDDTFEMLFQGKSSQKYELRHLQDDVFEWSLSLDGEAKHGRFHIPTVFYFLVEFYATQGRVDRLVWQGGNLRKIE